MRNAPAGERLSVARRLLPALGLLALLVLSYAPSLEGGFLWDDDWLVVENPMIRSPALAGEAFRHWLFEDGASTYYRPVQTVSYQADYLVGGLQPFGYRITNLLLHALGAALVARVLARLLPAVMPPPAVSVGSHGAWQPSAGQLAWALAMLWAVHPLHVAAVAYVSGRADPLVAVWMGLAWLSAFRVFETPNVRSRWVFGVLTVWAVWLALGSKEIALVWLGLLVVWLLTAGPMPAQTARLRLPLLLGLGLAVAFWAFLRALLPLVVAETRAMDWSPAERPVLALRALGDYAAMLTVPLRLQMERVLYVSGSGSMGERWWRHPELEVLTWSGWLVLFALGLACLRRGRWWRLRRLGVGVFVAGFLPFSHLVPIGNAQSAQHWMHLASIGYMLCLAGTVLECGRRSVALAAAVAAGAGWGFRTSLRSADWTSPLRFYEGAIRDGAVSPRIWLNLAVARDQAGDRAGALAVLRGLERVAPGYEPAGAFRAALEREGVSGIAVDSTARTAGEKGEGEGDPRGWRVAIERAHALAIDGNPAAALAELDRAAQRFGDPWPVLAVEARLAAYCGDRERALGVVERRTRKAPWDSRAALMAARLLADAGRWTEAEAEWRRALWLDVRNPEPAAAIASVRLACGDAAAAVSWFRRAVRRDPDSPRLRLALADALEAAGRPKEAARVREEVRERTRVLMR